MDRIISLERLKAYYMARLSDSPSNYGFDGPIEAFDEVVVDLFHGSYPAFSVDELLVRPREGVRFCDAVRTKLGNYDVPDDLILRRLLNRRKNPSG